MGGRTRSIAKFDVYLEDATKAGEANRPSKNLV